MKINFEVDDIIEIHDKIILEYGGDKGIVSISSLDFILDHAKNNPFDDDFFTILAKILQAITIDHPFIDGNKRTGIVIIESILEDNGLILSLDEIEKENFILKVARVEFNLNDLILFIKNNVDEF